MITWLAVACRVHQKMAAVAASEPGIPARAYIEVWLESVMHNVLLVHVDNLSLTSF